LVTETRVSRAAAPLLGEPRLHFIKEWALLLKSSLETEEVDGVVLLGVVFLVDDDGGGDGEGEELLDEE